MEKEFVPYEQALELRELGFDEPCLLLISHTTSRNCFTKERYKNSIWLGNGYYAKIEYEEIKFTFTYY